MWRLNRESHRGCKYLLMRELSEVGIGCTPKHTPKQGARAMSEARDIIRDITAEAPPYPVFRPVPCIDVSLPPYEILKRGFHD